MHSITFFVEDDDYGNSLDLMLTHCVHALQKRTVPHKDIQVLSIRNKKIKVLEKEGKHELLTATERYPCYVAERQNLHGFYDMPVGEETACICTWMCVNYRMRQGTS